MKAKLIMLLLCCSLCSCGIKKAATKNKENRTLNEQIETITKRKGDTVTYVIPNIKYKDTTIYTVNRQGTTLKTVYDSQGQISNIDCYTSMIEEVTKINRELVEALKNKDTEKEETLSTSVVLYVVLGAVVVIIIAMLLFAKYIKSSIPKL